jgi:hypothetical protein
VRYLWRRTQLVRSTEFEAARNSTGGHYVTVHLVAQRTGPRAGARD